MPLPTNTIVFYEKPATIITSMTSHKEQSLHTERVASLGSVSLHAHEQKIVTRIDEIDFNCVDEGYPTSETAYGRIRAAGEDVGMVMAIAGVLQTKGLLENFTPSELLERYITAKSIKAQEKKAKIN